MAGSERTIAHSLFTYTDESGAQQIAFRGTTVKLNKADIERGEKHDAFTKDDASPDRLGELSPYPLGEDGDVPESEQAAWVRAGKIDEIIAAVNKRPEIAQSVLDAELRRGEDGARKGLLKSLGDYIAAGA